MSLLKRLWANLSPPRCEHDMRHFAVWHSDEDKTWDGSHVDVCVLCGYSPAPAVDLARNPGKMDPQLATIYVTANEPEPPWVDLDDFLAWPERMRALKAGRFAA